MNKDHLLLMIDLLHEVNEDQKLHDHFNLAGWVGDDFEIAERISSWAFGGHEGDFKGITIECGTSACACGYAGLDPRFNKLGFDLTFSNCAMLPRYYHPERGLLTSWDAVCAFFDIDQGHAEFLFGSGSYNTDEIKSPLAVADRIEDFIKNEAQYVGL